MTSKGHGFATLMCMEDLLMGKYCFGDKQVNIIKILLISVNLNGKKVHLITEVVEGNTLWLLFFFFY